jgi:trans-2,3-dihydro-3-hydroxyanthranilate isomerase
LLNLAPNDVGAGADTPAAWSAGLAFLVVPLTSREALQRARIDTSVWRRVAAETWAPHIYLCHRDQAAASPLLHARMFAPAMGIVEDPATGAAACAVAGYLASLSASESGTTTWKIEQGVEMGPAERTLGRHRHACRRDRGRTPRRHGGPHWPRLLHAVSVSID